MSLLAVPLNVHLLTALEEGERSLADLSQAVGHPPATTLRTYLRSLAKLRAVERRQEVGFAGSVSYSLTPSGEKLLLVGEVLQHWLKSAPDGEISPGTPAAKSAVKALAEGWSTNVVRALASRAITLTELDSLIPGVSYPALERRLTAMRRVGLVDAQRAEGGRGTACRATPWLRQAVAPLGAAIAWERRHASEETRGLGRSDVEAALLLSIPLLEMPTGVSGSCRLAVEMRGRSKLDYVGVEVSVEEGRPIAWTARLGGQVNASAAGTPLAWFRWINGGDTDGIEIGGDTGIALAIADAMQQALLPVRV